MVAWHKTSRDMESDLSVINIPWRTGDIILDHTTIVRHRGMMEGDEESKRHQLHCRFILPDNRRRFGKVLVIAWNIKVLNQTQI